MKLANEVKEKLRELVEDVKDVFDYKEWKDTVKKHHPDAEIVSHPGGNSYAMNKTNGLVDRKKIVGGFKDWGDGDAHGQVIIPKK